VISRPLRAGAHIAGWVALAPLGAMAAASLSGVAARIAPLFALQTLTPWIYLPAYVVAGLAAALRLRLLLLAAALVAALHLSWIWTDLPWHETAQPPAAGPSFVLVSVNAAATNERSEELGQALAELSADVLVVEELSPLVHDGLQRSGVLDAYEYRFEDVRSDFFGSAIYSRFPLREERAVSFAGYPTARATVVVGTTAIDVVAVHTLQPLAGLSTLRTQLRELRDVAERSRGPLVMLGDFNATRYHRPFRDLLGTSLRDAHVSRGRGFARTWPQFRRVPAFALLDHVLVSEDIAVREVTEAHAPGSDHRAVVASLQLRSV